MTLLLDTKLINIIPVDVRSNLPLKVHVKLKD